MPALRGDNDPREKVKIKWAAFQSEYSEPRPEGARAPLPASRHREAAAAAAAAAEALTGRVRAAPCSAANTGLGTSNAERESARVPADLKASAIALLGEAVSLLRSGQAMIVQKDGAIEGTGLTIAWSVEVGGGGAGSRFYGDEELALALGRAVEWLKGEGGGN